MEATAPPPPPPQPPAAAAPGEYPITLYAEHAEEYNRFLPLVKWLLVLPHVLVLAFLGIGVFFAKIYAFFVVLFTGTYPRGVFDFVAGVIRWSWRVTAYAMLLNDRYPPFSLEPDPGYPAEIALPYPEGGIDNWRPLVHWLLIFPYALVAGLLTYVAGAVALVGVFVILFTGKLPPGMFNLILIPHRWRMRAFTYGGFMIDRYPPFVWDE